MSDQKVIVKNIVFRWEEKAPFVTSGRSVRGAIEYDSEAKKVRCHECGRWLASFGNHLPLHGMTARQYRAKHGLNYNAALCSPAISDNNRRALACISDEERLRRIQNFLRAKRPSPAGRPQNRAENRNQRMTCAAQLVARLKNIVDDLGRVPYRRESQALRNSFSSLGMSWASALERIGLVPNLSGGSTQRIADDILIEALRDFYVLNSRLPTARDWRSGILPNQKTYERHFGGLRGAYKAAGLGKVVPQEAA